ncbi:DUF1870 domain-containing protein [Salmonella enterica subsp. enterica]|nr:DUF1870 domain-containing protein [Salmonella enterica subsp. enterica]
MTIEECTIYGHPDNTRQPRNDGKLATPHLQKIIAVKGNESRETATNSIFIVGIKINNRIGNNVQCVTPDLSSFQSIYTEGILSSGKFINLLLPNFSHYDLERLC